jgi:hypothetical protein
MGINYKGLTKSAKELLKETDAVKGAAEVMGLVPERPAKDDPEFRTLTVVRGTVRVAVGLHKAVQAKQKKDRLAAKAERETVEAAQAAVDELVKKLKTAKEHLAVLKAAAK